MDHVPLESGTLSCGTRYRLRNHQGPDSSFTELVEVTEDGTHIYEWDIGVEDGGATTAGGSTLPPPDDRSHAERQQEAFAKIDEFVHASLILAGRRRGPGAFSTRHGVRTPMTRFARRSARAARRHAGSTTRRTTRTGGGGSSGDDGPASPPACSRTRSVPTLIGGAW